MEKKITHVFNAKLADPSNKTVVANYFALLFLPPRIQDNQDLSPFSLAISAAWEFCREAVLQWNLVNPTCPLPELGEESDWKGETLRSLWAKASEDHVERTIEDFETDTPFLRFSVDVERFNIDKIVDQNGHPITEQVRLSAKRKKEVLDAIENLHGDGIWGRNAYFVSCIENGDLDDVSFTEKDDEDEGEKDIRENIIDWLDEDGFGEDGKRYTSDTLPGWGVEKVFPPQSTNLGAKKNADTF